jgi:tetratricopeptide (TPR) repeat protein
MNEERLLIPKQLLRDGDYSAARIAFDEILAEDAQNITALVGFSTALGHLGLLNEALEVVQTALDIEPDNPEVHFRISWVYYKMEELPKARDHACKAIALNPDVGKYHFQMATVAIALRDRDVAFECIEAAHRLEPSIFNKRAYIVDIIPIR